MTYRRNEPLRCHLVYRWWFSFMAASSQDRKISLKLLYQVDQHEHLEISSTTQLKSPPKQ